MNIVIIGAGGLGREVTKAIEACNYELVGAGINAVILGYLDDNTTTSKNDYPILGIIDGWLYDNKDKLNDISFVLAIGNGNKRRDMIEILKPYKLQYHTVIHPSVVNDSCDIGDGCIILAGSHITTDVIIGDHVIINMQCTIGHDSVISNYTTLHPNVSISGDVTLGECVEMGTSSTVIQNISIREDIIVGAGGVVVEDINENGVYVGVPVKKIVL